MMQRALVALAALGGSLGFAPRAARAPRAKALRAAKSDFALLFDCADPRTGPNVGATDKVADWETLVNPGPRGSSEGLVVIATAALGDGVIVETEELHRRAYCGAFAEFQLEVGGAQVVWEPAYYDVLQNTVGGGKPKMKWYFTNTCAGVWPTSVDASGVRQLAPQTDADKDALVDALQDAKTVIYKTIVSGAILGMAWGVVGGALVMSR